MNRDTWYTSFKKSRPLAMFAIAMSFSTFDHLIYATSLFMASHIPTTYFDSKGTFSLYILDAFLVAWAISCYTPN